MDKTENTYESALARFEIELMLFLNDRLFAEGVISAEISGRAREAIIKGSKQAFLGN